MRREFLVSSQSTIYDTKVFSPTEGIKHYQSKLEEEHGTTAQLSKVLGDEKKNLMRIQEKIQELRGMQQQIDEKYRAILAKKRVARNNLALVLDQKNKYKYILKKEKSEWNKKKQKGIAQRASLNKHIETIVSRMSNQNLEQRVTFT